MVAVEHRRGGTAGPIWNELPDRFSDVVLLACAGYGVARAGIPLGAEAGWICAALALIRRQAARALQLMRQIVPPEECLAAHALLVSAVHLADDAARIRLNATVAGDMARAWDASSAAAGALMLSAKAKIDIQSLINRPKIQ